ncbi:uncharacterized [Tachysurus ichikawai]
MQNPNEMRTKMRKEATKAIAHKSAQCPTDKTWEPYTQCPASTLHLNGALTFWWVTHQPVPHSTDGSGAQWHIPEESNTT